MTKCDKCPGRAIIYQRYSGNHLCRDHFEEDVHRKIREVLRKTGLFGHGSRMALGLDGGQESAMLAFVLKNLFINRRDIELFAIIIDEGEERSAAVRGAHVAEQLRIPYIVKSQPLLQEHQLPDMAYSARKKELLLGAAEENEAGILATGETLETLALEIFMGYLRGDVDAILAKDTVCEEQEIAWIKPMRRIPGKEARLYAIGRDLGFANIGEMHNIDALSQVAKGLLCGFERRHPGTNYSLLRGPEKGTAHEGSGKGKAFK
jgi:tRNA(Ile)-lysidine synthase TilS/MesJ